MLPTTELRLDYAPLPRGRRRWIRRAVFVTVGVAGLVAAITLWNHRQWIALHAHALHVQYQSMHFARGEQEVCNRRVYTPQQWQVLLQPAGQAASALQQKLEAIIAAARPPVRPPFLSYSITRPPFQRVSSLTRASAPVRYASTTAYLHQRRNTKGARLVIVQVSLSIDGSGVGLESQVIEPSYWKAAPRALWKGQAHFVGPTFGVYPIDIFAGQSDPNDASRFTIVCRGDVFGQVILEGHLRDNDTVEFKSLGGPLILRE